VRDYDKDNNDTNTTMSTNTSTKDETTSPSPSPSPSPSSPTEEEEANIEKAVRFWKHSSLREIPTDQKRAYLHEQGVTDSQIHKAWERIVDEGDSDASAKTNAATAASVPSTVAPPLSSSWPQPPQQPQSPSPNVGIPPQPQPQYPTPSNPYSNNPPPPSTYYAPHPNPNPPSLDYPRPQPAYPYEDDGAMNLAQGVSLVTLGGVVGVTAAAAARWLNGGDFQLFPPPVHPSEVERRLVLQQEAKRRTTTTATIEEEEDEEYVDAKEGDEDEDEEDEDEDYEEETVQHQLLQQVQVLSETMKSHVGVQEKILQKLSNQSSITDHSMNLLRSSSTVQDNNKDNVNLLQVWSQLVELKAELRNIQQQQQPAVTTPTSESNGDSQKWEEQLELKADLRNIQQQQQPAVTTPTGESNGNSQKWKEQLELKADLRSIQQEQSAVTTTAGQSNGNPQKWEEQLTAIFSRMESCIEQVESSLDLHKTNETTSTSRPVSSTAPTTVRTPKLPAPAQPSPPATPTKTISETPAENKTEDHTPVVPESVPAPVPVRNYTLRQSVRRLAEENEAIALRVGAQLLYLYLINLAGKPDNPRYRKIFTCNESFQKVEKLTGGTDLLLAVGFEQHSNNNNSNKKGSLEWLPNASPEQELWAMSKLQEAAAALSILKSGNKSNDLTESALAVVSPDSDVQLVMSPPPPPPPPPQDDLLQTPAGSSLISPPLPKKMFVPPSGTTAS
jgi:hypothetical protein